MKTPRNLFQYPDFPEKSEDMSHEVHYEAILNFWKVHDAIAAITVNRPLIVMLIVQCGWCFSKYLVLPVSLLN